MKRADDLKEAKKRVQRVQEEEGRIGLKILKIRKGKIERINNRLTYESNLTEKRLREAFKISDQCGKNEEKIVQEWIGVKKRAQKSIQSYEKKMYKGNFLVRDKLKPSKKTQFIPFYRRKSKREIFDKSQVVELLRMNTNNSKISNGTKREENKLHKNRKRPQSQGLIFR